MHHKMKVLGVALVAVFALSAVAASSAFAVEGVITPGAFPATILASQENGTNTLTIGSTGARSVSCTTVHGDSTTQTSGASSNVVLGVTYTGCTTLPGGGSATVSSTGCDISATATEKINATSGKGSGALEGTSCDLSIVANSSTGSKVCEFTIANQAATGSILWESKASSVLISLNNTGVTVSVLSGTLSACGASGNSVSKKETGIAPGHLDGQLTATVEASGAATSLIIS